jgi:hypothetical protein
MSIVDSYGVVLTADDRTGAGVAKARATIEKGLSGVAVKKAGADADKTTASWAKLGKAAEALPGKLRGLYHTGGLGKAVDKFKEMRRSVDEAGNALSGFVPALGAIAGIATATGLGEMLRGFATFGTQITNTAAPLAVSSQELQKWQLLAQRAGVASSAVGADMAALNQKIIGAATGTDVKMAGFFRYFNISTRDAQGRFRQFGDVVEDVFARFKHETDARVQHN